MACCIEIIPDNEIITIHYENENVYINEELFELIDLDGENEDDVLEVLNRKAYTDHLHQRIVYTLEVNDSLTHLPLAVREIILQTIFRLADGREMIDKLIIDMNEMKVLNERNNSFSLPDVKDFRSWDARKVLKDLIYD